MTSPPLMHGLFFRQVEGDEALLRLAQERFHAAGLGPEFYANTPKELLREQQYHPRQPSGSATVHLPRHLRVLDSDAHAGILAFAAACEPGVRGMVLHDQPEVATHLNDYVRAVFALDQQLRSQGPGPQVFIEYACGLEVPRFVQLFEAIRDCKRVTACIDISHIGIRECQRASERLCPGIDVCRLKPNSAQLPGQVENVQAACQAALPGVLEAVESIGALGKPLHFHLHDSHPCSPFSVFGVSDHLSFGRDIPIPFAYRGEHVLPAIYGPLGLRKIVAAALRTRSADSLSFTLEIHAPVPAERRELGEYARLFNHWQDRGNAERMNHWIDVLLWNFRLLREAVADAAGSPIS
jgi:hypothetical protein